MSRPTPQRSPRLGRRAVLRALALGAGVSAAPGLVGCGGDPGGASADVVTFGNNQSDPVPKDAITAVLKSFEGSSGLSVRINTKQHEQYQEQITNYLQGRPDDVLSWFSGYRMRFFAEQGLTGDLSDVWAKVGSGFSPAVQEAATAADGKQYLVPFTQYPWGMFYRPSLWRQRGYTPPGTLDELVALATRMKADGLAPIAFAQKQGWPAMGTFDQLNFRINGYRFHVDLMAGQEDWQGPKVREVFDTWKRLLPLHQENALGRDWQEAARSLQRGEAGMYLLGSFLAQQFTGADRDDLDFFPFPEVNPEFGTDTVEAPVDGFMLSRKPGNPDGARKLLEHLASPQAQLAYLKADPTTVATSTGVDVSGYTPLQRKASEVIASAAHITQFLDRDTDPRFASDAATNGLTAFLSEPGDVDSVLRGMAEQAKTIFSE